MAEPADNYVPVNIAKHFRSQAFKVWGVTVAIVFLWVFAIVLAPLALTNGWSVSSPIYKFFGYICHQLPDRSLDFDAHPLAVCSRCFGVYFGLFAALIIYPLWRRIEEVEPLARFWLFLSLIPIGIDWSLTMFEIWENTHLSRFVTGLILGVACATFIIPALVEIKRNISRRHFTL